MNGLADVDGFKICMQMCVWLDFWPLTINQLKQFALFKIKYKKGNGLLEKGLDFSNVVHTRNYARGSKKKWN